MALEAVLIAACTHRLQGAELRMGLFVGIFYEIGVSFWSFLLPAWMGVLFRSQDFLNTGTLAGQSALWLLHGLLAVLAAWLSRGWEAFVLAIYICRNRKSCVQIEEIEEK